MPFISNRKFSSYPRCTLLIALFFLITFALVNLFEVRIEQLARTFYVNERIVKVEYLPNNSSSVNVGAAPDDANAYISIDLDFRISDTSDYPNLFQTDAVNAGLRAELGGASIGLVNSDTSISGGLRAELLADKLEVGKWYKFRLKALNGSFVRAEINGFPGYKSWAIRHDFSSKQILIGEGFSPDRPFHGDIRDISVSVARARDAWVGSFVVAVLKILLLLGFILSLLKFGGVADEPSSTRFIGNQRLYDPLLLLRAFACLLVVIGHGMMITHRPANLTSQLNDGGWDWLVTASPWGGVWIFFVLSGYLMGKVFIYGKYSPDQNGIWNFYRNRLLRIAPIYLSSILIISALFHPEIFRFDNFGQLISLLLFNYDGAQRINPIGSLWSIGTEIQFYLFAPIIFLLSRQYLKITWILAASFVAMLVWGLIFRIGTLQTFGWELWPREVYKTLLGNIDLFLCGFLTNYVVLKVKPSISLKYGTKIGFVFIFVGYIGLAYVSARGMLMDDIYWKKVLFEIIPTITILGTCLVIICFELGLVNPTNIFTRFAKKIEVFGLMTYAIYVWHEPVLMAGARSAGQNPSLFLSLYNFSMSLIVVLLVSRLMYVFIERPFDQKKKYQK